MDENIFANKELRIYVPFSVQELMLLTEAIELLDNKKSASRIVVRAKLIRALGDVVEDDEDESPEENYSHGGSPLQDGD